MDIFNKVTISNFIWYLVPGLGLIFFLIFPVFVMKPEAAKTIIESIGPFGLIILGIVFGFLLDGLRLYRLRRNYNDIKENFFNELKQIIPGIENPYLIQSAIADVANGKNISFLSMHHAIWIMLGHFAILSFFEAACWLIFLIFFSFIMRPNLELFGIDVSCYIYFISLTFFIVTFFYIGKRLLNISVEDQKNTNSMFVEFAKQHCAEVKHLLNISE